MLQQTLQWALQRYVTMNGAPSHYDSYHISLQQSYMNGCHTTDLFFDCHNSQKFFINSSITTDVLQTWWFIEVVGTD